MERRETQANGLRGIVFSTAYCDQYDNYRVRAYSGLELGLKAELGII